MLSYFFGSSEPTPENEVENSGTLKSTCDKKDDTKHGEKEPTEEKEMKEMRTPVEKKKELPFLNELKEKVSVDPNVLPIPEHLLNIKVITEDEKELEINAIDHQDKQLIIDIDPSVFSNKVNEVKTEMKEMDTRIINLENENNALRTTLESYQNRFAMMSEEMDSLKTQFESYKEMDVLKGAVVASEVVSSEIQRLEKRIEDLEIEKKLIAPQKTFDSNLSFLQQQLSRSKEHKVKRNVAAMCTNISKLIETWFESTRPNEDDIFIIHLNDNQKTKKFRELKKNYKNRDLRFISKDQPLFSSLLKRHSNQRIHLVSVSPGFNSPGHKDIHTLLNDNDEIDILIIDVVHMAKTKSERYSLPVFKQD